MNNYRNSLITERNTFVDEFEGTTVTLNKPVDATTTTVVSDEEREFNSRIRGNFDRIINYNTTTTDTTTSDVYQRTFVDDKPSVTTMQFKNFTKDEIYSDFRAVDAEYQTTSKVRGGAKALVMLFSAIILALSILIVFNTALLNNMNNIISDKTAVVETLNEQVEVKKMQLEEASDDEKIIEKAKEYGMVEGN